VSKVTTPANFQPNFWVVVPTYNPGLEVWGQWVRALESQNCKPAQVFAVDSGSTDGTLAVSQQAGFKILHVLAKNFNHGGTRQWALNQALNQAQEQASQANPSSAEFVVFMTHDALLANENALQTLLSAFQDAQVAAAYGRQLPQPQASWLEAHTRAFNYPENAHTVQLQDKARMGIKACFFSNSFAAYRVKDLLQLGGFPSHLPLGEDTYTAAKLLLSGQSLRYQASAAVYHSHNYNLKQDFQRMFDTGVFHAQNPWLLKNFGNPDGAGLKLVKSQWQCLQQNKSARLNPHPGRFLGAIQLIQTNAVKWIAYKLGRAYRLLPKQIRPALSMSKNFWQAP
jgi:rhamnosyltransferase